MNNATKVIIALIIGMYSGSLLERNKLTNENEVVLPEEISVAKQGDTLTVAKVDENGTRYIEFNNSRNR